MEASCRYTNMDSRFLLLKGNFDKNKKLAGGQVDIRIYFDQYLKGML